MRSRDLDDGLAGCPADPRDPRLRQSAPQPDLPRLRAARRRDVEVRRVDGLLEVLVVVVIGERQARSDVHPRLRLHERDGPALRPRPILRRVPRPQVRRLRIVRRRA